MQGSVAASQGLVPAPAVVPTPAAAATPAVPTVQSAAEAAVAAARSAAAGATVATDPRVYTGAAVPGLGSAIADFGQRFAGTTLGPRRSYQGAPQRSVSVHPAHPLARFINRPPAAASAAVAPSSAPAGQSAAASIVDQAASGQKSGQPLNQPLSGVGTPSVYQQSQPVYQTLSESLPTASSSGSNRKRVAWSLIDDSVHDAAVQRGQYDDQVEDDDDAPSLAGSEAEDGAFEFDVMARFAGVEARLDALGGLVATLLREVRSLNASLSGTVSSGSIPKPSPTTTATSTLQPM